MQTDIEFCVLTKFPQLIDLLKSVFLLSGQQIKKSALSKNFLERPLEARATVRLPLTLTNHREIYPLYEGPLPSVIEETSEFVAIHKPVGVHTVSQEYQLDANLCSWLASSGRAALLRVNPGAADRGLLWRLDRETSGLILYAKSDSIYSSLRENFLKVFRRKYYLAVVEGTTKDQDSLSHELVSYGPRGSLMKVSSPGAVATLSYVTLARKDQRSLLLVKLDTGHRHQIRVQLAHVGYPIVGDTLYGGSPAERLFLHCWRYEVQGRVWQDDEAELFNDFFDLHGLLQVIHNKLI